jgi:hypothetical protein
LLSHQKKIQHLYHRAGFGEKIDFIRDKLNFSVKILVDEVFSESENFKPIAPSFEVDFDQKYQQGVQTGEKKLLPRNRKASMQEINVLWLENMVDSRAQLREKMTLFWHGHFATRIRKPFPAVKQNNTLRKNALGNFGTLLLEISRDPAMLQFLNSQQNRKSRPNENFAREVMELFTLGIGNYTEKDVKEAARAFTGWGFHNGEFLFRSKNHDAGKKEFLGRSGNFKGEDIIEILLEERKTSEFITTKLYKYFVNEEPDHEKIEYLSGRFYDSNYDIKKLMYEIFTSEWFYDEKNIGNKIKTPVELIVNLIKTFSIKANSPNVLLKIQKILGQILFQPPNVSGWPTGKNWIDSSTLLYRMRIPAAFFNSSDTSLDIDLPSGDENNDEEFIVRDRFFRKLKTEINLKPFYNIFSNYSEMEIVKSLTGYLLQTEIADNKINLVEKFSTKTSREKFIEDAILRIISLPEYQLN